MSWSLYASGSLLTELNVRRAPTLQLKLARKVDVNPHTGLVTVTGDGRYDPAPITLRIWLEGADTREVLDALTALRTQARVADTLRYDDGVSYLTRSGVLRQITLDMGVLGVGVLEGELIWLPSEPYWRDPDGNPVVMP